MKKQFKTESKKLLDMMINSIYTHKEVFLRELISNASDACDKLYFRSLTDNSVPYSHDDYEIRLTVDKDSRTITVKDNGCGMTKEELESNLGTIAKSGSYDFKNTDNGENAAQVDIIGQFGVGFYSAFMVSDKITVESKAYGDDKANRWESSGIDGYTIDECSKDDFGTVITLHVKENTEDEQYDEYLSEWKIKELIKKYSDYIRYPIKMNVSHSRKVEGSPEDKPEYETYYEDETLNSMVPLWKKSQSEVTDDEYNTFYREKFYDYEAPVKVIRQQSEGTSEFVSLMFIPSHAPYDYYTKEFEKGLQLYSSGVLIMDKCKDLIPDYFSFVRGLVDSSDLSLNVSREMLQHDRQLKVIARAIEKKIASELKKLLETDRDAYNKFFDAFGAQLKYGVYMDYGMHKDVLKDLLMFRTSFSDKKTTLSEYVSRMKEEQKQIYYAAGENAEQLALLPQVEAANSHGFEVLYLVDDVDEFALKMMQNYADKEFQNVCDESLDLSTAEEKEALKAENEGSKDLLDYLKECLGDKVKDVRFTNTLGKHPVSLSTEGGISVGMEKTFAQMPGEEKGIKAELVLEINMNHPVAGMLKKMYSDDKDKLNTYISILFANARLISGLSIENPVEYSNMICDIML